MSKKALMKPDKSLDPEVTRKHPAYPVDEDELDTQQERLRQAAAAGAAVISAAPPSPALPAKPLAPLAAVWPEPGKTAELKKPATVQAAAPGPARAAAKAASSIVNVAFHLDRPGAHHVSVCGEFNGWSPEATPLKATSEGHWEVRCSLRPGRYEYKFIVDGEWLLDPSALENVPNSQGSLNSVLRI